jgi:ubiquinone/menaquinone biosynthesis C-methylase UbiE
MIVSRFSLPYWTQPEKSFKEMARVLKPGSKVIFEALNRDFPTWKLLLIKIRMLLNQAGQDVRGARLEQLNHKNNGGQKCLTLPRTTAI